MLTISRQNTKTKSGSKHINIVMRNIQYKIIIPILGLFLLSGISVYTTGCAVNPVSGKKELMLMSASQERALGLQYDPSVIASFGALSG